MPEKKVTTMVLNVDLQCSRCHKKVKKVLSKFPQIRDQMYDKETNTVTITVVCCSPEKIRDKIRCKGGKSIKSIKIELPQKHKETEKQKEKTKDPEKKKEKTKDPVEKIKEPGNPNTGKPIETTEKNKEPAEKKPDPEKPPQKLPPPATRDYPPIGFCCTECYHGHGGGPCYFGGPPPPSRPCYGRPVYDSWGLGGGGGYQYYYASEENPQACSIM